MPRSPFLFAVLLSVTAATTGFAAGMSATLDPDKDGTIDMMEAKTAGAALFDRLDRDRDGTLDRRELSGRVNAREFAAANPDKDGTLDKSEYLDIVEQRFIAANPDGDFTIDAKELASPAGKAMLKLLK